MADTARKLASKVLRWSAIALVVAVGARTVWRLHKTAERVVLMPSGNVGNAPFFLAPMSWLMTWRSRRLHTFVGDAASRHGAVFVDLFREPFDDPFVKQPELNAADGLHPSDAGYGVWFGELMVPADVSKRLSAALAVDH